MEHGKQHGARTAARNQKVMLSFHLSRSVFSESLTRNVIGRDYFARCPRKPSFSCLTNPITV